MSAFSAISSGRWGELLLHKFAIGMAKSIRKPLRADYHIRQRFLFFPFLKVEEVLDGR